MREDYLKAQKKGRRAYQKAVVNGQYPFLPALDDILQGQPVSSEMPQGLMEIPLSMVTGTRTRGRQEAFSNDFMPLLDIESEFATKWIKLYDSQIEEGIRDPVKVYEYLWNFYVQEGNKRVSVLKYMDVPMIMADVIRIMPVGRDDDEIRIYDEFLDFFQVVPLYEIRFTQEGSYRKLAAALGQNLTDPWPEERILDLRSAFSTFRELYEAQGGDKLRITPADAFLTYIGIYHFDSLLNDPRKTIDKQIEKIWDEFLVEAADDNISFQEQPSPEKKDSLLSPLLNKLIPEYTEAHPLRIAFIYDRNPADSRWIYGHELGRNHLSESFGPLVRTIAYEDCNTEEEFNQAVAEAAVREADLVITPSAAQMDYTLRAAIQYPKIKFLNCSINQSHNAVRTYYGRMYEAKFIMGALAASMAHNHVIGYVADYPIFGSLANINAFAIGAAMIDPYARIHLTWSSYKDRDWKEDMREANVRVLSGPDLIKPTEASREYGLYYINDDHTIQNLAMPVWDWGKYYELIVRTILNDTWPEKTSVRKDQALNYWWGMSAGVIDVIFSKSLPYYSVKMMNALRRNMISGSIHPFEGELHSQTGIVRPAGTEGHLSNEEIVAMSWLNDNIIGSLPEASALTDAGKKTITTSGVIEQ